jgi:hypothetical protein
MMSLDITGNFTKTAATSFSFPVGLIGPPWKRKPVDGAEAFAGSRTCNVTFRTKSKWRLKK